MDEAVRDIDEAEGRIGPGRLVLVVGPSGAGKDTLIAAARARLAGDETIAFPRRIVTRPPSPAEDNSEVDEATFAALKAAGGFALAWAAHGHSYGIPAALDHLIAEGRTVVCNVSRGIVAAARTRYARVEVVEVTAPAEVLAARLAARSRPSDGDLAARAGRVAGAAPADAVIVNDGAVEEAAGAFVALVARRG